MRIDDQPGDFVVFVGNQRIAQKPRQRYFGQRHLRRNPLLRTARSHPGEQVA